MVKGWIREFKDNFHVSFEEQGFTKIFSPSFNFNCLSPVIEHKPTFCNVLQMQMSPAFTFKKIIHGVWNVLILRIMLCQQFMKYKTWKIKNCW